MSIECVQTQGIVKMHVEDISQCQIVSCPRLLYYYKHVHERD